MLTNKIIAIVFVCLFIGGINCVPRSEKLSIPTLTQNDVQFQDKSELSHLQIVGNGTIYDLGKNASDEIPSSRVKRSSEPEPSSSDSSILGTITLYGSIVIFLIGAQVLVLYKFGQPAISRSGKIKLWHGSILDDQNSQHLTDWYTFSHVLHGVIFYGILAVVVPSVKMEQRFLISVGIEVAWEILENSPTIIDRYRSTALAQGYTGDSIINSVCDTLAMSAGFLMAHILPIWLTVGLGIAAEVIVGILIRDNLTLNVIQLIHPFEAISKWQASGKRL
jgi:hypothetical protein